MKQLFLLVIILLSLALSVSAQEASLTCISEWSFVNAKHVPLQASLIAIPVEDVWIGYGNFSQWGQEAINAPKFHEMSIRFYALAHLGDLQVAVWIYSHPDTPETVYIFPLEVIGRADANGDHYGNHPPAGCSMYKANIQDVRDAGIGL